MTCLLSTVSNDRHFSHAYYRSCPTNDGISLCVAHVYNVLLHSSTSNDDENKHCCQRLWILCSIFVGRFNLLSENGWAKKKRGTSPMEPFQSDGHSADEGVA